MISNDTESVNIFKRGKLKTEHLNVRSVKVYGDGALGSRGNIKKPYSDDIHNYGKLITGPKEIVDLAKNLYRSRFSNEHPCNWRLNH